MIKKLLKSVGEYKRVTILTPIFVSFECLFDVIIPYIMSFLIDKGISIGDTNAIIKYGLILVLCSILAMISGILSGHFAARATSGFAKNLRKNIYYNVQKFSFANIDKFSTSGIVTRSTTDVKNVQLAFQMIIRIAVRAPLMLIFSLIMALKVNVSLGLIFLAAIPFLGFSLGFIAIKAHPIFEKGIKIYDKLNNTVEENIRGIRIVKSYVTEEKEIKRFEDTSSEIYNTFSKQKILNSNKISRKKQLKRLKKTEVTEYLKGSMQRNFDKKKIIFLMISIGRSHIINF